jgi:hypothetical protein
MDLSMTIAKNAENVGFTPNVNTTGSLLKMMDRASS